jgi:hypothetical protein
MVKVGEALLTIRDKFISYLNTLTIIPEKNFTKEQLNDINEVMIRVKAMNVEAMITYISMFIVPNKGKLDLYIKNQISDEFLTKLNIDEYNKIKRYLDCMIDIISDK